MFSLANAFENSDLYDFDEQVFGRSIDVNDYGYIFASGKAFGDINGKTNNSYGSDGFITKYLSLIHI